MLNVFLLDNLQDICKDNLPGALAFMNHINSIWLCKGIVILNSHCNTINSISKTKIFGLQKR